MIVMLIRSAGLIALTSCALATPVLSPSPEEEERAAVYAAALEYLFVTPTTRQLVVAPYTTPDSLAVERFGSVGDNTRPHVPFLLDTAAALPATWRDYVAHNREREPVPTFRLSVPVEFIESPIFARPEVSTRAVLVDFPHADGHVWLSGIGFDSRRREAIVSAFQSCGALCGFGGLLVLERTSDDTWVVRRQLTIIQS